jgi:hypothetical protein
MMTEKQQEKFRKVLDLNWECKELQEAGKWKDLWDKSKELHTAKEDLKEDMGDEAYDQFIETGRKMFAPLDEEN